MWKDPSTLTGVMASNDDLDIKWNLGLGFNTDFPDLMTITCVGPREGVAIPRES